MKRQLILWSGLAIPLIVLCVSEFCSPFQYTGSSDEHYQPKTLSMLSLFVIAVWGLVAVHWRRAPTEKLATVVRRQKKEPWIEIRLPRSLLKELHETSVKQGVAPVTLITAACWLVGQWTVEQKRALIWEYLLAGSLEHDPAMPLQVLSLLPEEVKEPVKPAKIAVERIAGAEKPKHKAG